jgi:hypothetical protein
MYRGVTSGRLHPLLCSLTSADEVSYQEQRNKAESNQESGKFRSLLYDMFGQVFEEDQLFPVDREAVALYKQKVDANLLELRAEIRRLLDEPVRPASHSRT